MARKDQSHPVTWKSSHGARVTGSHTVPPIPPSRGAQPRSHSPHRLTVIHSDTAVGPDCRQLHSQSNTITASHSSRDAVSAAQSLGLVSPLACGHPWVPSITQHQLGHRAEAGRMTVDDMHTPIRSPSRSHVTLDPPPPAGPHTRSRNHTHPHSRSSHGRLSPQSHPDSTPSPTVNKAHALRVSCRHAVTLTWSHPVPWW